MPRHPRIFSLLVAALFAVMAANPGSAVTTVTRTAPYDEGVACFRAASDGAGCVLDPLARAGSLRVGGQSSSVDSDVHSSTARVVLAGVLAVSLTATAEFEGVTTSSGAEVCLSIAELVAVNYEARSMSCTPGPTSGPGSLSTAFALVAGKTYSIDVTLRKQEPAAFAAIRVTRIVHTAATARRQIVPRVVTVGASGFHPSILVAHPGEEIVIQSLDPALAHAFMTNVGICLSGSEVPSACNVSVTPLTNNKIYLHDQAPIGVHDFFGNFPWMVGKIIITQP